MLLLAQAFGSSREEDSLERKGESIYSIVMGRSLDYLVSKPMKSIHKNAYELRLKDSKGQVRVVYVLAIRDKILIPHVFVKKSQKTPKKDLDISRVRLKELLNELK